MLSVLRIRINCLLLDKKFLFQIWCYAINVFINDSQKK